MTMSLLRHTVYKLTKIQTYIIDQLMPHGVFHSRFNTLKGRGVNWLHLAIQI